MRRSARAVGSLLGLTMLVVASLRAAVAYACDRAPLALVGPGILGLGRIDGFLLGDSGEPQVMVPRNVAFIGGTQVLVDDVPIATTELGLPFGRTQGPFLIAEELLPAGAQLTVGNTSAIVEDVADTVAPSTPDVAMGRIDVDEGNSGCAQSSCGNSALLHVAVTTAVDDHTPTANLVYAIFVATAPSAARTMEQPTELVFLKDGELQTFIDFRFSEHDVFVSVAAIDFAANQSARSEPIRVHRGDSGCTVTRAGRAHIATWLLLGLSVMFVAFRNRKVALPQSS